MRFLLYNIRYATGAGLRFHSPLPFAGFFRGSKDNLARIERFITSQAPDVVGLVEVDRGSYRSGGQDQAASIARALGQQHMVRGKYPDSSLASRLPVLGMQSNAVITGLPCISHAFHDLSHGMKRLVIEVELEEVTIFLVHLALTFRHRHYQLENLNRLVARSAKPVIVAGDFNVLRAGDRELALFMNAAGLRDADPLARPTYPSSRPRRRLDFILHGPELHVKDLEIPDVRFSDHLPLVCEFG